MIQRLLQWFSWRSPSQHTHPQKPSSWLLALHSITMEMARDGSPEVVIPDVLSMLATHLDLKHTALWMVDEKMSLLRCQHAFAAPGFPTQFKSDALERAFPHGIGLPGRVWKSLKPEWIPDVTRDPNFPRAPLARDLGLRGAAAFPVTGAGKFMGVLEFAGTNHEALDETKEIFFRSVGEQLGQYLLRKEAEEKVASGERRWLMALEGAGDGVWDWKLPTGEVYFSDTWKTMLGYKPEEIPHELDSWKKLVHPDDVHWVIEEIQRHIKGETPRYVTTHRMLCKDGSYKWILDRGQVVEWTRDGQPFRMIGTHADIDNPSLVPPPPPPIEVPHRPVSAIGVKVLVVDDDEDSRNLITTYLQPLGVEVIAARNGQEAVERAGRETFNLVFMDVQMPVMDGLTAAKKIRDEEARTGKPRIPIIAVTARAYIKDYEASVTAGCNTHISKPLNKDSFLKAITPFLGSPSA